MVFNSESRTVFNSCPLVNILAMVFVMDGMLFGEVVGLVIYY